MKSDARVRLGSAGEGGARRFLEARGYRFIEANWRCADGEIDLVMLDGDELVFVEVKTRRGSRSGRASEAISEAKARNLLAAGEWYIAEHTRFAETVWRCDLVAITLRPNGAVASVELFENAVVTG